MWFVALEALGLGKIARWAVTIGLLVLALAVAVWAVNRQIEGWREGYREEGRREVRGELRALQARVDEAAARISRDALIHIERIDAKLYEKKQERAIVTRKIIERIPAYVSDPLPDAAPDRAAADLLVGLVVLHDAAVAGVDPDSAAAAGTLEAARAVVPSHFARVLVSNIGECQDLSAQVNGLLDAYEALASKIGAFNAEVEAARGATSWGGK